MEEPSEIASIFGGDEAQASRIPEDLRPVLLERWSKLRKELDSSRPDVSGASASDSAEARKDEDPSKICPSHISNSKRTGWNKQAGGQNQKNKGKP